MSQPNRNSHDVTKRTTAPLGSSEYQEQMLEQGQAAMDRALAMPLVRLFFGLIFAMSAVTIVGKVLTPYLEGGWQAVVSDPHLHLKGDLVMLIGTGAVAFTGRARRKWFYDFFRNKSAKSVTSQRGASDGATNLPKV